MEVVGGVLLAVHVPFSEKHVTIQVSPNVGHFQENQDRPSIRIRQVTVTTHNEDTRTLTFDFGSNNVQSVEVDGQSYEIKLLHIGKEKMEGQEFPFFEFLVTAN